MTTTSCLSPWVLFWASHPFIVNLFQVMFTSQPIVIRNALSPIQPNYLLLYPRIVNVKSVYNLLTLWKTSKRANSAKIKYFGVKQFGSKTWFCQDYVYNFEHAIYISELTFLISKAHMKKVLHRIVMNR